MNYYPRIKDLRENKKLSQKEIATMLECTQTCYSRYEQGQRDIPTAILIKLASILETSIDFMLEQTNNQTPNSKAPTQNLSTKKEISNQAIESYLKLDNEDRAVIRGEMKQMLRAEKYQKSESLKNA